MLVHLLQSVISRTRPLRLAAAIGAILCTMPLTGCGRHSAPLLALPTRTGSSDSIAAQAVADQIALASPGDQLTVEMTEGAANALVAPYLAGTMVDGLTLWFEPDRILVRARASWRGDHIVLADASVSADDGRFLLAIDTLLVDGKPIPRWIRASLAHAASDALSDATLPVDIERITIQEGVLILVIER